MKVIDLLKKYTVIDDTPKTAHQIKIWGQEELAPITVNLWERKNLPIAILNSSVGKFTISECDGLCIYTRPSYKRK